MALNTSISVPPAAPKASNILDLPDEILKEICSQCFQSDWIRLSLVCRRFRDLAAAQLYRNFHIVFPDEDDPYFDSPIDGLAGGLETFVASDYNYAKHLRELSLDTLSIGDRAELAYKPYLASVSCGKFMNTLLLLTLRKAQSLDTFRWNIRVELSRPVYKALHNIKSLRHLHLRLQAGSSIHQIPPPFSDSNVQHSEYDAMVMPVSQWTNSNSTLLDPVVAYGPPPATSSLSLGYKPSWRNKPLKKPSTAKEPLTIEGFRNLESLSVLDIDSLDVITEVQVCVRNSSSTLRKVKLSFSDSLAMQARKPCTDAELDESEDDEFQVMPISLSANYDDNGPAKAFQAQEERKLQELVLGRIFEVEPSHTKNTRSSTEDKKETTKKEDYEEQPVSDNGQNFIDHVNRVFERMVAHVNGTSGFTSVEQQDALDAIAKAAKKYVTSEESKSKSGPSSGDLPTNDGLHSLPKDHELGLDIDKPDESQSQSQSLNFGLKPLPSLPKDTYDANPEDIDIEIPEEQLTAEFQRIVEIASIDTVPPKELFNPTEVSTIPSNATEPNDVVRVPNTEDIRNVETEREDYANRFSKETRIAICGVDDDRQDKSRQHLECTGCDVEDVACDNAVQTDSLTTNGTETHLSNVNKYARDTRGIGLHSLSIHLIPIKASVLGKAIDLHSLKRITLLNVGEQKKFWVMMMKENSLRPLPLRKVFTDDVCLQFLHLISQLDCVKEVFMLQRSPKYKPESFAPNPGTTIEQIRNFVLKKHMHSLKRLMIKNQADSSWDVDEKTMQHICRRGKVLEELAVIMGMRAIHTLIQRIAGLTNLRALQLISFRTEDTCLSVMRETRRFIVDALSFHPELKLEWLALGDDERAVRIVRKSGVPRKSKASSNKDKKPVPSSNQDYVGNGLFPIAPVEWGATSESDEDDDDDPLLRVKLELVEPFSFYDIFGIRIFEKEIVNGRL
ncbi:hypothetical protein F4813DRAFT_352592 [Daldinia decipiens]|uniref:uncharacterized protein n=1 Tax=Daldinia decipiens TaxID=326647 RepID=UPI0020C57AA6|nr:uncharacterized protein F4813DRAFT_352592 [Daldinia decipiens]KAI1659969.1 hypothetical protein F4813DRAFT_352592 [Daldinia decipiens]